MSESSPASSNTRTQSQRQRDLALDAEASRLDTHTDIGLRETLRHMRRAMGLIWLFPGAFSARAFLLFGSLARVSKSPRMFACTMKCFIPRNQCSNGMERSEISWTGFFFVENQSFLRQLEYRRHQMCLYQQLRRR